VLFRSELLELRNVGKVFQNGGLTRTVLQGVEFNLHAHDAVAVVGPSGCGKTTLLLLIAGLLPLSQGCIRLEKDIILRPTRKIALVLQHYGLFPWMTVAENVTLGARLQKLEIPEKALEALKGQLGIEGLDDRYPCQLSGGERQRVALSRALLMQPRLLLLDEPFAALDTTTRERLQDHLVELFTRSDFSLIIVTHNLEEAVFLGRRIVVLDERLSGIRCVIDNPEAIRRPDYRNDPRFFTKLLELRTLLRSFS
jgi:NitT/TauT family transport system ATP-binding protein